MLHDHTYYVLNRYPSFLYWNQDFEKRFVITILDVMSRCYKFTITLILRPQFVAVLGPFICNFLRYQEKLQSWDQFKILIRIKLINSSSLFVFFLIFRFFDVSYSGGNSSSLVSLPFFSSSSAWLNTLSHTASTRF